MLADLKYKAFCLNCEVEQFKARAAGFGERGDVQGVVLCRRHNSPLEPTYITWVFTYEEGRQYDDPAEVNFISGDYEMTTLEDGYASLDQRAKAMGI